MGQAKKKEKDTHGIFGSYCTVDDSYRCRLHVSANRLRVGLSVQVQSVEVLGQWVPSFIKDVVPGIFFVAFSFFWMKNSVALT